METGPRNAESFKSPAALPAKIASFIYNKITKFKIVYCRANQGWQWRYICLQLLSKTLTCTLHLG